ncbi:MAG: EAL domain-containing protein [Tahibacter sp.]
MAKILVVDDHSVNREFLSVLLTYAGHSVLESKDGAEALQVSRTMLPDLVISDIFMPTMDGVEFAQCLRLDPLIAHIPIIFYTATYRVSDIRGLAESCGVARVLPKPSEPYVILQAVAEALGIEPMAMPSQPSVGSRTTDSSQPAYLQELGELQQRLQDAIDQGMEMVVERGAVRAVSDHLMLSLSNVQSLSLRLAALLEMGMVLSAEREPRVLLDMFCRAAQSIMNTRYAALGILDADGNALKAWASRGLTDVIDAQLGRGNPRTGIFERVIEENSAIRLNDLHGELAAIGLCDEHPPVTNLLVVPVRSASTISGWFYVADKITGAPFGEEDEQFAVTMSAQLGLAYGNLMLRDESERNAAALRIEVEERRRAAGELRESELRFRELAENIREVFFLFDAQQTRTLYVSPSYTDVWGRPCEALYADQATWVDSVHPDDREWLREQRQRDHDSGGFDNQYRIQRPDGSVRWVHVRGFPIRDTHGHIYRIAGVADDITERKEQEAKIARLSRIRAVQSAISSAILRLHNHSEILQEVCQIATTEGVFPMAWAGVVDATSPDGRVVGWSGEHSEYCTTMRFTQRIGTVESMSPASRAVHDGTASICNDIEADPSLFAMGDALAKLGLRSVASLPLIIEERVVGVITFFSAEIGFFDQEEISLLNWLAADLSYALDYLDKAERLDYLAYYDSLTGLPNSSLFHDRLSQFIRTGIPEGGELGVILIDLVRFTHVNDTLGRIAGDRLLKLVAARLTTALGDAFSVARISADTFAITGAGESMDALTGVRSRTFAALDGSFVLDGLETHITAQAGIALYPGDGDNASTLFKNAEVALHHAKRSGEPYLYYSAGINTRIAARANLEARLRSALANEEFVLHYQPRVDLVNGEIVGAEALIRWQRPDHGLIGPAEFIGVAEETGLIVPIGAWVLKTVCEQQATWQAAQIEIVPVAVNLSAVQVQKGDILAVIDAALQASRLDAKYIELELTESATMYDPEASAHTLRELRRRGVGLALDDFGTGFSSLAHLKRFPFHEVKIDRSFVAGITQSPEDAAICTAVIAMAHSMGLKVVAEGIETEGQLRYLRSQGCDEMQGNYFSPAVPADAFRALLRSGQRLPREIAAAEQQTVLIVDDEHGVRAALHRVLRREGYRVLTAASGEEGLETLAVNTVHVIISDQRMPGMSGTDFLGSVKQMYPDTVRIILSGYTDIDVVTQAVNRGAVFKFLTKPWDDRLLREQVRDAFRRYRPTPSASNAPGSTAHVDFG